MYLEPGSSWSTYLADVWNGRPQRERTVSNEGGGVERKGRSSAHRGLKMDVNNGSIKIKIHSAAALYREEPKA